MRRFHVEMKLAPHSAGAHLAVRNAARLVDNGRPVLESFASKAFVDRGKGADFLLDHDADAPIGRIVSTFADGVWITADAIVELHDDSDAPAILERLKPGARVSPKYVALVEDREHDETGTDLVRILEARLEHVALLERGDVAGYQGAIITRVVELDARTPAKRKAKPKRKPAGRSREVEGELVVSTGIIRRHFPDATVELR